MTPAAWVRWTHDVFGNAVATATFAGMTDRLTIAAARGRTRRVEWPVFAIAASAIPYPFLYSTTSGPISGAAVPQHIRPDPADSRLGARLRTK